MRMSGTRYGNTGRIKLLSGSVLATLAGIVPLQLYGQSRDVHAQAPSFVESSEGHEHASEGDHDHQTHDDRSPPQHLASEESASRESDESDHDHKHDHGAEESVSFLSQLVGYLGRFHPPMVNFPIAMLAGAALAEILFMITGRVLFANAARFCIWIGAVGALAAGVLGWFFAGFQLSDSRWVMTVHRWLGTTTVAWSVLALILSERVYRSSNTNRTAYRAVLFVGAALVSATGFFGGALIYGIDHYVW